MNTSAKTSIENTLLRYGIGFDPHFFERIADAPNFPPHNIEQLDDDLYRLTLAVAGFSEPEIDIVLHNDVLTISGQRDRVRDAIQPPTAYRLLYSGIAFRDFSRQFKVGEHVYVENATLDHGLLQIDLARRVPESMKPKKIEIGSTSKKPATRLTG